MRKRPCTKELPFTAKLPNAESREALHQAREGEDLTEYASLDDLRRRTSESCDDRNGH